jgi:putative salt-induced outer membrane protein YdiY
MKFWTRSYVRVAAAFFACLSMQWMEAVEVRISLRNGDVLRGRLISEGDVVLIEHAILGDVEIPKRSVRSIIRPNQNQNEEDTSEEPEKEELPASEPWMKDFVRVISFEDWSRQFEFGMNLQSGRRDKFDYNARFNMRRRIEKNDFRFEARRYFGESDQEKTTDRLYSNFRWRRDLSPGVFYQSDTLYSSDAIKEIDVNLEQTLGLGYRLLNQKALKVSTGAGLSGRYREDNVDNGNTNYLLDVFQDLDYRLGSRLRLTQEFRIALPPDERSEYEYEFQAGIVSKVTDSLHLSIRYQLEYDRSLPEDRREDQRIVSSVGIDF